MNYKSDAFKQTVIPAQTAVNRAVDIELAKGGEVNMKSVAVNADKIYTIYMKLVEKYIDPIKGVQKEERKKDVEQLLSEITDMNSLHATWALLSEEEQKKYRIKFNKIKHGLQ